MNGDCDVLIVGGGLVGGSLALALRNSPLRVAVVESQSESQRLASAAGDRALALSWGSSQILAQLGIWEEIEAEATPIKHIHVSDRGHFGKVRLHADVENVAALGYVATARVIERAIARALQENGVDILCPASLIGVKAGPEGVHVSLKQDGESFNLTSFLLVGADGGNSTVRRLLEIGQVVRDYHQAAMVTEVVTERPNRWTAYERFTESGPLAFLPLGANKSAVVWTLKPADADELLTCSESEFTDRLQCVFGYWLGRISLAATRQAFPLKLIRAESMRSDRVLLIGNAMHQLHPVAGQGFNLGLRDVASLAEMLVARQSFGDDIGEAGGLDRYVRARRGDLDSVIRFTDGLVGLFSNDFKPVVAARNLGLLGLDHCRPFKHLLARHAMGLGRRLVRMG